VRLSRPFSQRLAARLALVVALSSNSIGCDAAAQSASAAADSVAWMLFVDDLHLDFRNTGRIRQLVQIFLKEIAREGDLVAIRTSGPSGVLERFRCRTQAAAVCHRDDGRRASPVGLTRSWFGG
jgi:hypothetical protein